MLDVARGSGIVARTVAQRLGPEGCVVGLDFNQAMLANARRAAAAEGLDITWREGSAEDLPFEDGAFERAVRRRLNSPALELPFALGDPVVVATVVVATLLREAGFSDVSVEPVEIEADYSEPDRFIELQVAASAAIPALQGLDAAALETLIAAIREDMSEPVREATAGDRLRFPMQGIVARAMKT